jgi:sugar O-acyltransferase (sialic acid O-acetyltransferase NeuD family)
MAGDPVAVIGAGGHGRVVAGALAASGTAVAGFYDDDPELWGREIGDSIVLGPILDLSRGRSRRAVVAIGDNRIRKRIAETFDVDWVTVVHPYSWVDTSVDLGPGTVVAAGTVVQPGAVVGAHVILNAGALVNHDAVVGDYAHISAAHLGAEASAGEGALLAVGSTVVARVHVGAWATVGAGAVALRDVEPEISVVGIPAARIRR